MPPMESFPKSHIVTFKFYLGVILFLEEDYVKVVMRSLIQTIMRKLMVAWLPGRPKKISRTRGRCVTEMPDGIKSRPHSPSDVYITDVLVG